MTPEERFERIEAQIEFLANHQAQLTADLIALKEADQRRAEQIDRHTGQIELHSEQIGQQGTQISQLADMILRLARVVEEQGRRSEVQEKRFDERLNALIDVVERYFSNGRDAQ